MYRVVRGATALLALASVAALGFVSGCSGSEASTNPADLNGSWMMTEYRNADEDIVEVDPEVSTELTMADGQANGVAGVNTFTGSYEAQDDGTITFGQMASTLMAGPDNAQAQEDAFFVILGEAAQFEVEGTSMTLLDATGDELAAFEAAGATPTE